MDADEIEADFQQYYQIDVHEMIRSGGFSRASRLLFQLPPDSRFVHKHNPMASWSWSDMFNMMIAHSLRQLVWAKTKDAQKKVPTGQPQLIGPEYVLKSIREANKRREQEGKRQLTPNARVFKTAEELDEYLKRPRKATDNQSPE